MTAADDLRPLALPDLLTGLEHVCEDLEMIDEDLTLVRHETTEGANVVELHAIISDVNLAWAYARTAMTALESYTATVT